jgi:hypothetical protein
LGVINPPRRLIALTPVRSPPTFTHTMDETIFLVVLGAVSILYAAGWLAISLPQAKRTEALGRARLGIRRVIVALGRAPLRGP